ncbi:MAG TPA: hypothetical protein VH186_00045 [Chloroflexia bacterium]|nr:hypothetical protein [Chloroflexia bacterium]
MPNHDLVKLEGQLKELHGHLTDFSSHDDILELIKIIHRPGWTTPAEFTMVSGLVSALISQVKTARELKQTLMAGSQAVGTRQ